MSLPFPSAWNARSPVMLVPQLRELAIRNLAQMYRPDKGLFVFRVRRTAKQLVFEGSSPRYTAIALIGLAGEEEAVQASVLAGVGVREACERLVRQAAKVENLGDLALTLWAAATAATERRSLTQRILAFRPDEGSYPTVEVAWTLAALCADADALGGPLRDRLARRLIASFESRSHMFPHGLGVRDSGFRKHVCCFADLVYPTHALAWYADLVADAEARDVALQCATTICRWQGCDGQWWWHYDRRSGTVLERYPVYAVHQDAMAPMALFAVESSAAVDMAAPIAKGLAWLAHPPELNGISLVDTETGMIWRKVARREPGKLSRYAQAAASRLRPGMRISGLNVLLPPCVVDYEDRPYHLGWLLYAWPARRVARWHERTITQTITQ